MAGHWQKVDMGSGWAQQELGSDVDHASQAAIASLVRKYLTTVKDH